MCSVDLITSEQFYGITLPASFLADYMPSLNYLYRLPVIKPLNTTIYKSCLRYRKEKSKKKVIFADDKGLSLERVKIINEPSDIPPLWALKCYPSLPFDRINTIALWELGFKSPSADYVEFRRRINEDYVSLDKVVINEEKGMLEGTVKVKNIDFNKNIFVRSSSDNWGRYEDKYGSFLESGPQCLYDTFSFCVELPINSSRLDFCICFSCNGRRFWDSNKGNNYVVKKSSVNLVQRI